VANLTMARGAVLAGLHQVLRANSWRLLYTAHTFAREVASHHAETHPAWRPYKPGGGSGGGGGNAAADNQQQEQQQMQDVTRQQQQDGRSGDAEMADAAPRAGSAPADAAGDKLYECSAIAAVAVAAAEGSLDELAPLAPLLPLNAQELEQRLSAHAADDAAIWLAVWLRRQELAALQAAAAAAAATKAANASGSSSDGRQQQEGGGGGHQDEHQHQQQQRGEGREQRQQQQQREEEEEVDPATAALRKKCPKVLADLVESLVAATFIDSGCDWGAAWDVAEWLMWREGVVQLPALPADMGGDVGAA
jgi:Spy/CpxP family protein refolding chaperone